MNSKNSSSKKSTFFQISSTNTGTLHTYISNTPKYSFGWAFFEEPDEFDEEVRQIRKDAGIVDPEPSPRTIRFKATTNGSATQILYSGNIVVNNPRFTRQITNVTGSVESDDDEVD